MAYLFVILVGLIIGSFLNVIIHRGPAWWDLLDPPEDRGTLWGPRSQCPSCGKLVRSTDNIPLLSYVLLKGKCRDCATPINVRYPIIEALGGIIALMSVLVYGMNFDALWFAIFGWTLIALATIDAETGYLPDMLTYGLIATGLIANVSGTFVPLFDAAIGAFVGFGIFWTVATAYRFLRGQEGLGLGDAKLLSAIGAWLGWLALSPVVLISSVGAIVWILATAKKNEHITADLQIRFGPALALAGIAVGALHQQLITLY